MGGAPAAVGSGTPGAAAPGAPDAVRHLYLHLPFCVHRCGYCDFVTAVGRRDEHGGYVEALLAELRLETAALVGAGTPLGGRAPGEPLDSIFLGGGTPTFTEPAALTRLLTALPAATELTVEANPETVTPELATTVRGLGVNRVSVGAQSFQPQLLQVLERTASPDDVRGAVAHLRSAGFDNLSLDLIYGIPGQSAADLAADLAAAIALEPEHLSCYELEAKPGTRFSHAHGAELERQAEAMEGYFETVVETLTAAGYRWYETANFCREESRDLRAQHNLGYWRGRDYLGVGMGAVSTVSGMRWRNAPGLAGYVDALTRGERPPRELEPLDAATRARERVMLGLRLDQPLQLAGLEAVIDGQAITRLERHGLVERVETRRGEAIRLTPRGRFLGGAVTVELIA